MFESVRVVAKGSARVVVLGQFQDAKGERGAGLDAKSKSLAAGLGVQEALKGALGSAESTGEVGSVLDVRCPASAKVERVLVAGLGQSESLTPATMRAVGSAVARRLAGVKAESAQLELVPALRQAKADEFESGNCLGEAFGLVAWTCDQFRGTGSKRDRRSKLSLRVDAGDFSRGVERGLGVAQSANMARTLSQTPPNVATPAWIADQARRMARQAGLSCKVFSGAELAREKFEGLINVGKASENKPCMIRLEYAPKGASRSSRPIVLVGKTMTYDTGGLSLKVNNGMVGMKRDKDGGCAVFGAMHAIATVIKPRRRVVALLAAAENSVSDEAYRPDDVLTFRNGVTVEVTNTDAEGRLVLADALCYACDRENPASIVDLATLTGGVVVALGSSFAGMFCDDDKLRARVEAAANASGERVWRLPMHQEYRDMMKSPVADIINSNPNREAHPIQGAAFLSYFVEQGVPWCHLDIAGVHVAKRNAGMFVEGPTGWGVRLLASLVENH